MHDLIRVQRPPDIEREDDALFGLAHAEDEVGVDAAGAEAEAGRWLDPASSAMSNTSWTASTMSYQISSPYSSAASLQSYSCPPGVGLL